MQPLRVGMTGDAVVSLQLALVSIGLLAGEPTGQFDNVTQRAVIEMQRRAGLQQTGVVDENTWSMLYQMTSSVQPANVDVTGVEPVAEGGVPGSPPSMGFAILIALGIGVATYWAHKKARGNEGLGDDDGDESDDDEEDYEDDDEADDVEEEHDVDFDTGPSRLSDLDDAVTDSLLEQPARIASSRRAGDCKKAARRLLEVRGLVRSASEHKLYDRVIHKVANDCHEHSDAVEEAVEDDIARIEEIEDMLGTGRGPRSAHDVSPLPKDGGFRKTKKRLTKSTTSSKRRRDLVSRGEVDLLDSISHSKHPNKPGKGGGAGRPGASAVGVRRKSGERFKVRKEKSKATKRGYTWRKES